MIYAKQTIYGQPPSKSNSYKIITINGHSKLGKTDTTKKYELNFFMQCTLRKKGICKRFKLIIDIYFQSDRSDLDNALKIVLDCLQTSESIKNDRLCSEIYARKFIDKKNPRIEFTVEELL